MSSERKVDRELAKLLVQNADTVGLHSDLFQEFFRLVRGQALEDASDYATRCGNRACANMREANPGAAKKIRDLFYGLAHEIRSNGHGADELVRTMLKEMRPAEDEVVETPEEAPVSNVIHLTGIRREESVNTEHCDVCGKDRRIGCDDHWKDRVL